MVYPSTKNWDENLVVHCYIGSLVGPCFHQFEVNSFQLQAGWRNGSVWSS